ncbi:hypothetical protein [Salipiger bermudensis]|uniref:hypothetical protein n=1 Tax=Salipiger bermudensis TaxID=344736 RepID=UPI001CD2EC73|nr:hypothetical protein [Salipiger bermudensis]MCA0962771.1 hypothetical protein [Salipiger bermudensis]
MDEAGAVYPANEDGRFCVPHGVEARPTAPAMVAGRADAPDTLRVLRRHAGECDILRAGPLSGDVLPALSPDQTEGPEPHALRGACHVVHQSMPILVPAHARRGRLPGTHVYSCDPLEV